MAKHRSTASEKKHVKDQKDLYDDMDDYMDDKIRNADQRTKLMYSQFVRNSFRYNGAKKALGKQRQLKALQKKNRKAKSKQSDTYKHIKKDVKKASKNLLAVFPDLPVEEIIQLVIMMMLVGGASNNSQPANYEVNNTSTNMHSVGDINITQLPTITRQNAFERQINGTIDMSSGVW